MRSSCFPTEREQRSDVDDRPTFTREHAGDRGPGEENRGQHVELHQFARLSRLEVSEGHVMSEARVIDQHVERLLGDLLANTLHIVGVAQVSAHRSHGDAVRLTDSGGELVKAIVAPRDDEQIPPIGSQPLRVGLPDSRRGTGHHRHALHVSHLVATTARLASRCGIDVPVGEDYRCRPVGPLLRAVIAAAVGGGVLEAIVLFGALLELLLIVANIGTAVVIFPIVRRRNEELAFGYVTARVVESTFILVGIVAMLGIITLREQVAGPAAGTIAYTLAAIKDWTFLLGPGWVVGLGNGLILGYLMYRSGLVPRRMCWLGLIGGPLIIVSGTALLLSGNNPSHSMHSLQAIVSIPEFLWELFLGVYCTVWGFRRDAPILSDSAPIPSLEKAPVLAMSPS